MLTNITPFIIYMHYSMYVVLYVCAYIARSASRADEDEWDGHQSQGQSQSWICIIIRVVFLQVSSKLLLGTRSLVLEELPVLERGSSVRR